MKEREEGERERASGVVYVSGLKPGGFIYLEHLWRITGLPGRQPWPVKALCSCLPLKGQQRINQSEDKERKMC